MILIVLLLSAIFLALFSMFFPEYYMSELILSFLPYMLVIWFVWFLTSLVLLRSKFFRSKLNKKYLQIVPLFVLLFGLLFFLSSRQYNQFYTWEWFEDQNLVETWEQADEINEKKWLDILYSNILYINTDYIGLQNLIEEKNPDMIFMVEFTDDHEDSLNDILKENYPYSARTSRSQRYFGNVVFSKYPITNLTHAVDQWAWRYSYFHSKYNGENYYIYLVHASSPVTYRYFEMRNNQFDVLSKDFVAHQENMTKNDKILMLWDFNVSPRSYYYKELEKSLIWLNNVTSKFTILFTWGVKYLPFLRSHIDHIFVSESVLIGNIEKIDTPGSDHSWFFIENVR